MILTVSAATDRMKDNGLFHISFGIESIDEKIRAYYGKPVYDRQKVEKMLHHLENKFDIPIHIFFLLGHPQETEENMLNIFEYGKLLYPDLCSFVVHGVLNPFPGTQFYEQMKAADLITTKEWISYGRRTSVIKTSVKPERFERLLTDFWKNTYSRPKVFKKQILNLFSKNQFRRCMARNYFYMATEAIRGRFPPKLPHENDTMYSKN